MTTSRVPWRVIEALYAQGWEPIPVPAHSKQIRLKGVTGAGGERLSLDSLERHHRQGDFANLAVRLPLGVVGVDVDAHSEQRDSGALADFLPHLPATWTIRNRPDSPASGTYLYRAAISHDSCWRSSVGCIDVIRREHRYVMMPGSIHPEGRMYRLDAPHGQPCAMPSPDMLPMLPLVLIDRLSRSVRARDVIPASSFEIESRLSLDSAHMCDRMAASLDGLSGVIEGSRHDTFLRVLGQVHAQAAAGHTGLNPAVEWIRARWHEVMDDASRSHEVELLIAYIAARADVGMHGACRCHLRRSR